MSEPLKKRASHVWARDPHDWYVEPEWCSARLFEVERFDGPILDPACGLGRIVGSALDKGLDAYGSDIEPRWEQGPRVAHIHGRDRFETANFLGLWPPAEARRFTAPDAIVSNPPFSLCGDRADFAFLRRALERAPKVALLLPATYLNGGARQRFLGTTPLRRVWFLSPRPSMPPGAAILAGAKPGGGTVDFAWFVWLRGYDGAPEIRFLRREAA